jgi:hypothetical protein
MLRKSEMSKRIWSIVLIVGALVGLLTLTACTSTASALETTWCEGCKESLSGLTQSGRKDREYGYGNVARVDDQGTTRIDTDALQNALSQTPAAELSDVEAEGILFMREEEKLARDVYLTLYDRWQMQVFSNIADSESTHMEAAKGLIDRYGLSDPVEGKGIGEFANEELQALYDQLVEQGSLSLVDALQVGATIEEIDILDLEERVAQTDNLDIQLVYDNLMRGSRNHLRAFVSSLERQGVTYEPSYLSPEQFEEILSSGVEQGGGQSGQGGQGGRGGGGRGGRGSRGGREI